MSALASTLIDPAPRLAPELLFWTRIEPWAESLVRIDHIAGTPPRATVSVLSGPREGEVIPLPPGAAMREDSGAFTDPAFPFWG